MEIRTNLLWVLVAGLLLLPAAAPSAVAQDEGIKVHGAWVVEVLDPDGTVVSRTEFANALVQDGARSLVDLLRRGGAVGKWSVRALLAPHILVPQMVEGAEGLGSLSVGAETTPSSALVLSGAFVVPGGSVAGNHEIQLVSTALEVCREQGGCQQQQFSRRVLSPFVGVQSGQIVQITVRISFS